MKLDYKRELDHNYMVLEEEQAEAREGYEIYMMEENQIPGLLKCTMQRMDCRQRFFYEVTSRQSLALFLERKRLQHADLLQLLKGMRRAVAGAREYLLNVNHLMLLPEYMYLNLDIGLPELCWFPYYEKPIREQFFELAEYLLGKLDRQDRMGVELGYEIYKMASEENCSLEEILKSETARAGIRPAAAERIRVYQEEPPQSDILRVAETVSSYGEETSRRHFWSRRKKEQTRERQIPLYEVPEKKQPEQGGTCLLSERFEQELVLYGINPTDETLVIKSESFLIGKKRDAVDGCISHPAVSRIHARIERRDQEYYLVDLNSTNGTYLNERLLEMNESVRLNPGDVVRFADVEYTVGM